MKRSIPIALIVLGALLSIGAFGWLYFAEGTGNSTNIAIPDQIAGLQISDRSTGAEAMSEFENLHGKQFPLTAGAIGMYGNQQITLWAAATASNSIASQMVDSMQAKIAESNSPFTPLTPFTDNDRMVFVLEGMGQKHYYFQSQNLVIWLAADPSLADDALQQTLEAYP